MKQTPLHDVHVALGAKMVEFGGWHMPVSYASILAEARCVRERAGLFDLGHMGRISVTGADCLAYLDSICTNYIARIPSGSIRYTLICKEDGNPIDDLLVYRGDDEVYLVVNASNTAAVLEWMQARTGSFAVTLDHRTERETMIALQGPLALEILGAMTTDCDLAKLGYYKFTFGTVCGRENTRISRTGYTGENGFELYFENAEATDIWQALLEAGSGAGVQPIGLGARDTLRLEAGMPLFGHEIDAEHNPVEADLGFALSFAEEKGDWVGKQALLDVRAKPQRALIGFTTAGKRVPRQGYKIFQGEREVGEVASGAVSPTLHQNIGTAYLPLDLANEGNKLEMDIRGKRQGVTLHSLPFYSRTRK
ncbi:MAG TPA: glycine cleavage system aminomethyltransferase GcvT [Planctomycetes bacterium]|nr:glycine cleavage system aminomethyltransferase GcvT [Planctomycetota bacterium]HIL52016.1 glycine cleavage system aminomethyltransferase GcvT [Planctomycetota bacterium]